MSQPAVRRAVRGRLRSLLVRTGVCLALAGLAIVPSLAAAEPTASPDGTAGPGTSGGPTPGASPAVADTSPWWHRAADGSVVVDLYVGWSSTCPHCARAKPVIEQMDSENDWLQVTWLQVNGSDPAPVERLLELAQGIGQTVEAVPAFLYAGKLVVGWDDAGSTGPGLYADLRRYLDQVVREESGASPSPGTSLAPSPQPSGAATSVTLPVVGAVDLGAASLPLATLVLASLDAFNPCALSVLLFLMSVLAGTRRRSRMALVGGTFVVVSGVAYFLFMAAWLNLFLIVGMLPVVTLAAGLAALVVGAINVKDYAWLGRGPSLVIPQSARPRLFGRMLDLADSTRLTAMLAGTILVAIAVNGYEMICTGGFPVMFTRLLTLQNLPDLAYYGYLFLYCLIYVIPLAAIVVFFTVTLGSRRVSERQARVLKLLSGLLMLELGLLLVLAPDRLGDFAVTVGLFAVAIAVAGTAFLVQRLEGRRALPRPPLPAPAPASGQHPTSHAAKRRARRAQGHSTHSP